MTALSNSTKEVAPLLSSQKEDIEEVITASILRLINTEPFYGACVVGMTKIYDEKLPAPAAVNVINATPTLYIHPDLFLKFNPLERCAVIKHEILHLLMSHIQRAVGRKHMKWNIAADLAINQLIRNIPPEALDAKKMTPPLPEKMAAEFYYDRVPDDEEKQKLIILGGCTCGGGGGKNNKGDGNNKGNKKCTCGPGSGRGPIDTHDKWGESDDEDTVAEVVKGMVIDAQEKTRGLVPSEVQSLLPEILKKRRVPWNVLLRTFVATMGKVTRDSTWKRENRRFGDFPGHRRLPGLNLLVIVDTSGSVSDQELGIFFDEINNIHKDKRNFVRVMECDAAVHATYKYTGKPPAKCRGRGGTCFTPALEEAWKLKPRPDGIVYLTDGYGENPNRVNTIPVIWVVTPNGTTDGCARFGRIIRMDKKQDDR